MYLPWYRWFSLSIPFFSCQPMERKNFSCQSIFSKGNMKSFNGFKKSICRRMIVLQISLKSLFNLLVQRKLSCSFRFTKLKKIFSLYRTMLWSHFNPTFTVGLFKQKKLHNGSVFFSSLISSRYLFVISYRQISFPHWL